jgi:hypothetical protein
MAARKEAALRYAARTDVPLERSREEIERLVSRYGATAFAYGWREGHALLTFEMGGWRVRFVVPMPEPTDREIVRSPTGRARTPKQLSGFAAALGARCSVLGSTTTGPAFAQPSTEHRAPSTILLGIGGKR